MFTDYLDRGLELDPSAPCLKRPDGSDVHSYAEFFDLTHRFAAALDKRESLGPGSKVAVFAPNCPRAFAAVIGVIRSGAAWVALNPRAESDELAGLLALLECDFLILAESFRERAEPLLAAAPTIRGSIVFKDAGDDPELDRWLGPSGGRAAEHESQPDTPAMYMGTGGTTGASKGVPISHRQLQTMCLAFNAQVREAEPPVYLMATPMTHAAGGVAFPILAEGGCIVVHDGVRPAEMFDSIERNRVTRTFLPPTAVYALLAAADVRDRDFSTLKHFLYAAAPMSVDKLVEAIEVFGPVMAQTFGQSEAPLICTYFGPEEHAEAVVDPEKRNRLGSCGRASMVARVAVMDDDGRILETGETGELVVRGDLVMSGYHANPEASAAVRRPGGWHGTGDIGYIDADGFVYIVDRKRDMIISGGFNVFPSEVEQVIWSHDAVLDCTVIGIPDEKWGEAVTAVVELKPGHEVSEAELVALCKARLGSIRAPKSVDFRELPRSSAGKVLKRALREDYWQGQGRRV
jgi:acyl-CoA synthetase (AMP-forming)/AMP-acid ligase II